MNEHAVIKSNIVENNIIVNVLSFCFKYYNNNHLFYDIRDEINCDFCYNLNRLDSIDATIIENLRETIDYSSLHKKLIDSFDTYCECFNNLKSLSLKDVFDFEFFSLEDLKKTIFMNELIHHFNLEKELLNIVTQAQNINPNIINSILFIINNYEVFSLKYLNIVKKDEGYKRKQGKFTILWFNVLIDDRYIEESFKSNNTDRYNLDEYIKYRLLKRIFYDPDFLEDLIYYVGLSSKEVSDKFNNIISNRSASNEIDFSSSNIMIKILELMLDSEEYYEKYTRLLIEYIIDNKNRFLNDIYNSFITSDAILLKYLKLILKLCIKHSLKDKIVAIMETYRTIFFANDAELIDIILNSEKLLFSQNLSQLQYVHYMVKSYIDMTLSINNIIDFDEISFKNLLINELLKKQSIGKRVIELYLPLYDKNEYGKKIVNELNKHFSISTKGLDKESIISLFITSAHLVNRLLELPYCDMVNKNIDFTRKYFFLNNDELFKYQDLYGKIVSLFKTIDERYQNDDDYSDWVDDYFDLHNDSLVELENEISINQITAIIRAKKCYDYLDELDHQIIEIRSAPLTLNSLITIGKKRRIYKILKEIRVVDMEESITSKYFDDFQLKRIEQLDGCFEYLSSTEDYWNTTMARDSNRIDYTPYVANYIKLIEIVLIEIIKKFIERKKSIGQNVIFKSFSGSLVNLTNEKELHLLTLGDILHFLKTHDDIIILDKKSVVYDYLFYFKDKIRNSKFHTSKISNFQEAYEIRYNALSTLKRILYDIY